MASPNLTDSSANYDWGVFNPISNGGNQPNLWRTLNWEEWQYLFEYRETPSSIRYAKANVNNVNGVILLPDDWSTSYCVLNNTNTYNADFSSNSILETQWSSLEQHGAVFLPAAGERSDDEVYGSNNFGYYWSASCVDDFGAYAVSINTDCPLCLDNSGARCYGWSGRLALGIPYWPDFMREKVTFHFCKFLLVVWIWKNCIRPRWMFKLRYTIDCIKQIIFFQTAA